ncbi:hypothetical protein PLICRDRAFT_92792 [Plicaturopsis crispa FD-325 SS-3]|nr:hypothetical protein PLICRDRAFT_92792 [Plicaturopsis crispa FD-325 SS-3]
MSRPAPTPHRTPLRRISQNSLFHLSHSNTNPDAPHGLGFLEPALAELVDEAESLSANADGLKALGDALEGFNESFAGLLYIMNMNALTVDWLQAPTEASFVLARRRAEEDAQAALAALAAASIPEPDKTTVPEPVPDSHANTTTDVGTTSTIATTSGVKKVVKKKGAKPKLSAKEKKERNIAIENAVSSLPLEFRGNDPNLRRNIEMVIESLMDNAGKGLKLLELVHPPDLTQARVNKCLIALVNRKIVQKENSTGAVLYHWIGTAG